MKRLIGAKPYFVVTLNTDDLIYRSELENDLIVSPCGSMLKMQCGDHIVDAAPICDAVLAAAENQEDRDCANRIEDMDPQRFAVCPECGKNLKSMKYSFQCDCGVNISKTVAGKKLTDNMVAKLLDGEKLPSMTFKSNAGKSFNARLYYSHEKKDLAFDFSSGIPCPFCGKDVNLNRGGAFCECGLKVFKNTFRRTLTDREIKTVLKTKKLPKSTFPKKDGGTYETELVLDPKEKTLTFPPRK